MRAYKYRIYPNCEQKAKIAQHFGCTRFVYNWGLEAKMAQYQQDGTTLSCFDLINKLKELKSENEWLKEVDSQSLPMALRNLDNAYTRFFREKKGFPKFRSKHNSRQSYQIPQRCLIVDNSHVKIPKLGLVKAKIHRECMGKTGTWTISKTPTGKYFVSITTDAMPTKPCSDGIIGIDLGIKTYATCSDGNKIDNPKWLRNSSDRLAVLQRRASKKVKGSSNRKKANLKVAKCHEKITNQRKDWQHKWSAKLVSENKVICLEDLNVTSMLKDHHLARSIQECAWSQFVSFLEYKADWYGSKIIKIGRFEPSSKLCSCGYLNKNLTLADREWTCPSCHTTHDRDLLASQNILKFGLKLLSGSERPIEPVEMLALAKSKKQEAQHLWRGSSPKPIALIWYNILIVNGYTYNQITREIGGGIEAITNGGKGSGNWGHLGRPGMVGGSGTSSERKLHTMKKAMEKEGGFTISLNQSRTYKLGKSEGYAVGGFGSEKVVDLKDVDTPAKLEKVVKQFLKENRKAFKDKDVCLGGWVPGKDDDPAIQGKLVLDASKVFKNKKDAVLQAIKTDQDSITDFKNFDFPSTKDLAKEFGLEKEYKKYHGLRAKERNS